MTGKQLTWRQVHAWRLSQHALSPRLQRRDFIEAVRRTGGIQAQLMSAAELALWARVDGLTREDVQSALWQERTLVKTWAMRATLHLLASDDLPLYVAARTAFPGRDWLKEFTYYGATQEQYEAFLAAVPQILGGEPMTRDQLAKATAERVGSPELSELLVASSWGSHWKPLAWRGELCFGPNRGQNITFVRPSVWTGVDASQDRWLAEPWAALQEIARRYLRAYGPARMEDFVLWWGGGFGLTPGKKLFRMLEDELERVDVEGWKALALRTTIEQLQASETSGVVRLLPLFDAYTLGVGRNIEPILPMKYKMRVYRPQGWISAVVLVDGRMEGTWEYETKGSQTTVKVRMFSPPVSTVVREGIEAEAERLGPFLDSKIAVRFEDS